MPASEIERLSERFWESVGEPTTFPRDLSPLLNLVTEVLLIEIRELCLSTARRWFNRRGVEVPLEVEDRLVKGLLVAFGGRGVIFLDADLPRDERRVILAHEFDHYLAEYLAPRARLARRLGSELWQQRDGARPIEPPHEWAALLAGVPLDVHTHFLDRENSAHWLPRVEATANELALELLAPHRHVLTDLGDMTQDPESIRELLMTKYGLPPAWASGYADAIARSLARRRCFSERLGL